MVVHYSLENIIKPNAIALGNFDGIHQGHKTVIKPIFEQFNNHQVCPTLVTFFPHPQEFFSGEKKQLLTPLEEKQELLAQLGIKQLILLPFDRELASLSAPHFVQNILVEKINAKYISVGEDFCFGYRRQGNAEDLQQLAEKNGVKVNITKEEKIRFQDNLIRISSSAIREGLKEGNLELVKAMLGRHYSLIGKVVEGDKIGRTIGFPTANIEVNSRKFLPRKGVYAVIVEVDKKIIRGVMNRGERPTVSGLETTNEIHLLNWSENLYNKVIKVNLIQYLRSEQKFNSLNELKQQINLDCQRTSQLIKL
ncbi:MAG: bifunctional riboflavin kinase/FAD synthetase [Cyanobacterium sp. T60_A2020_053]|nr:bifunctional riboflavin kinase/FAD synthetase [Cyanobacterium sp. T60_A2020_053]